MEKINHLDFPKINKQTFPLTSLKYTLNEKLNELRFGLGFLLLKRLPKNRFSDDDMSLIFYGLCKHIGNTLTQSWNGELLGNVIDISDITKKIRGYNAGGKQDLHCDSCDIIGLMCLSKAKSGGKSKLANSIAIHNHLLENNINALIPLY